MATRDRLVLLLVALLATLPLLLHGASCGHDLSFHLLSWQEAATQFAHGNLHPRWAFTPAFNAGEPRFVFYPPLSWTLGALLTLLAPILPHLAPHLSPDRAFAFVPVAFTFLALATAALAMHHLARKFLPPATALLVSSLYLVNPYTLFTAYERTAFAELLAATWIPLLLAAVLPSSSAPDALPILATALPLALLWLTNAPAAVIGSYALATVVLLRLLPLLLHPASRPLALPLVLRAAAASALAFALAAFYIAPALIERPWVQIGLALTPGMRPEDNILFRHTPDVEHDVVLHTVSTLAVTLLVVTLLALLVTPAKTRRKHPATLPILLTLTILIGVFLTPVSLPLWHHLPQLAYLQFPWRLLTLLAPTAALALGLALPPLPSRLLLASSVLLPLALIYPAYNDFQQSCEEEDTPRAQFALFHSSLGDKPTDEYTPAPADNEALSTHNPPFRLLPPSTDDLPPPPTAHPGTAPLTLQLHLATPAILVLNLRAYPTWHVLLNQQPDTDLAIRSDGLLAIPLPAGDDHIQIRPGTPRLEQLADILSALTLLGTLAALRLSSARRSATH